MPDGEPTTTPPGPPTLRSLVDLERLDRDVFRAGSPHYSTRPNLFGGQVSAQSIAAAAATAPEGHHPHSFHLYFMRPGRMSEPILLYVDRIRDGRSFTTRNVVARQDGEAILTVSVSFHKDEPGVVDYQQPMADVPRPGDGGTLDEPYDHADGQPGYVSMDVVRVPATTRPEDAQHIRSWMRLREDLGDDRLLHACALAYMTDTQTGSAPMQVAGRERGEVVMTSLDHALHFHRPIRADDWILVDFEAVSVGAGRGLTRAAVYDVDGRLGATLQQELLMRVPR